MVYALILKLAHLSRNYRPQLYTSNVKAAIAVKMAIALLAVALEVLAAMSYHARHLQHQIRANVKGCNVFLTMNARDIKYASIIIAAHSKIVQVHHLHQIANVMGFFAFLTMSALVTYAVKGNVNLRITQR